MWLLLLCVCVLLCVLLPVVLTPSVLITRYFHCCRCALLLQTTCPHLVRYLAVVAIITAPKRPDSRDAVREFVRMIRYKTADFSDPITQLLASVYIDFDFELALELLPQCEKVRKYVCSCACVRVCVCARLILPMPN